MASYRPPNVKYPSNMDTALWNDLSGDESALIDDFSENESSLGISPQHSGLTDEDLFGEEEDCAHEEENEDGNILPESSAEDEQHINTTPNPSTLLTPVKSNGDRGPLSPFSPLLRTQQPLRQESTRISWQSNDDKDLSLLPCRKVSVVVKVKVPTAHDKLCLFPLIPASEESNDVSLQSPTLAPLQAVSGIETNDLVAVNPTAFGKYIPAQVTMDTARLVAKVVSHVQQN